jgi:hypothetical protein
MYTYFPNYTYIWLLLLKQWVTKWKPNINSVEVHPQLSHSWVVPGWILAFFLTLLFRFLTVASKTQIVRTRATVSLQLTKNHKKFLKNHIHMGKRAVVATPRTILDGVRWSRAQVLTHSQCVPAERVDCEYQTSVGTSYRLEFVFLVNRWSLVVRLRLANAIHAAYIDAISPRTITGSIFIIVVTKLQPSPFHNTLHFHYYFHNSRCDVLPAALTFFLFSFTRLDFYLETLSSCLQQIFDVRSDWLAIVKP